MRSKEIRILNLNIKDPEAKVGAQTNVSQCGGKEFLSIKRGTNGPPDQISNTLSLDVVSRRERVVCSMMKGENERIEEKVVASDATS